MLVLKMVIMRPAGGAFLLVLLVLKLRLASAWSGAYSVALSFACFEDERGCKTRILPLLVLLVLKGTRGTRGASFLSTLSFACFEEEMEGVELE